MHKWNGHRHPVFKPGILHPGTGAGKQNVKKPPSKISSIIKSHLVHGERRRESEHQVFGAVEAAEHGSVLGVVVKVAAVERVGQDLACEFRNSFALDG